MTSETVYKLSNELFLHQNTKILDYKIQVILDHEGKIGPPLIKSN